MYLIRYRELVIFSQNNNNNNNTYDFDTDRYLLNLLTQACIQEITLPRLELCELALKRLEGDFVLRELKEFEILRLEKFLLNIVASSRETYSWMKPWPSNGLYNTIVNVRMIDVVLIFINSLYTDEKN